MAVAFIVAAVIGLLVGVLSGMLGIGGGVVMVPIFRLGFGLSAISSTATSLFTIIPTSVSGAVMHIRGKSCIPKLGIVLGIGGACTSTLGVWLAQRSPAWLVMVAAALAIAYSSVTMFRKAMKAPKVSKESGPKETAECSDIRAADSASVNSPASKKQAPTTLDGSATDQVPNLAPTDYAKAVGIGLITGVVSGYIGLGGGFIMVPLMLSLLNMPMRFASGTSLIAVMVLAIPATIAQCMLGNVDYLVGIAIACGSIPGAIIGARLVSRIPERTLRFVFAAFLCLAAVLLVVKELGFLG